MYTLAIDDVVEVPVKFTLKAGKVNKPFAFTLIARRVSKEESEELSEVTVKEFLLDNVTGWIDQRLVLGADGRPVDFCRDALEALIGIPGVIHVCWNAYRTEVSAKGKN